MIFFIWACVSTLAFTLGVLVGASAGSIMTVNRLIRSGSLKGNPDDLYNPVDRWDAARGP